MSRGGLRPAAHHVAHRGERHGVHVLHVHRAATPQAAVLDLTRERVELPVGRVGRHDVEVTVHQQCGPARVGALDAGDDARAARLRLEDRALETDLGQLLGDVLRGRAFVPPAVAFVH